MTIATAAGGAVARTTRRRQADNARWTALALLLVMLGGLSITVCTRDWISYLPAHDHLLLNARALGLVHHAHHGDALAQALGALGTPTSSHEELGHTDQLAQPAGGTTPQGAVAHRDGGVVSLSAPSGLQPELNSYTATGLFGLLAFVVALAARALPRREASLPAGGEAHAPLSPPPRFA